MLNFPYTILPSKKGKVYKPYINVVLNYKKTHKVTLPTKALIDSGADVCFCHEMIGTWLGIKFNKTKNIVKFTAANGQIFDTKLEEVCIYVGNKTYNCKFYFSDVLPSTTPIILGQIGFFDNFKVIFDLPNKVINLE
ncbi:MAG: hypothetical protein ACD_19C00103G0001 [uncultured bacterium]|uniref:Peptidase A2 domain-containing protein n=1 Tax=Candidatus Roizmanbacteria bacterium GW2011_GWA2_35_8 TaxID=1618479 RepID=A0A0G0G3Z5_9BACT|nr:MAG: hypothetical protein ACD_19C00103G0001 [uncultured bacterium]KKP86462.1 MAG: hypothetical protein UR89_C0022G0002 [Candidatus Roizmanbacteria bacterium GW2011_GWA2_35_8]